MIDKSFEDEIIEIHELIKSGNDGTVKFEAYLKKINLIKDKDFSTQKWPHGWREKIYRFAEVFKEKDAGAYIKLLKPYIQDGNCCEICAFIYSEIIWQYYEQDNEYNKDLLKNFIKGFEHNPEFHHTYGHFLLNNKTYDKSLFEYQRALNIESDNFNFIDSYFSAVKSYFENLISTHKVDQAKQLLEESMKYLQNRGILSLEGVGFELQDRISSMKDRVNDYVIIEKQVEYFKKDIENTIKIEQRRLIEILGIFSGILAFILTNISIAVSSVDINGVLKLMIGMAIVLLIFVISISYLFGPRYRYADKFFFLKKAKFWSLIILFGLLFLLLKFNQLI